MIGFDYARTFNPPSRLGTATGIGGRSGAASGAVASSVWEFDKDNTRSQLEALKVVDGFQRAVIWETNGPEFVAVSSRIADGPSWASMTRYPSSRRI